jgi:ABC-2 type transport system permease protein
VTRLLVTLRKEFLQIRRNPLVLRLLIIAPVIQLVLLGYAANLEVKSVPIVFCDLDGSAESRRLMERITASGYFVKAATLDRPGEIYDWLDSGAAAVGLVLPAGFARSVSGEDGVAIQALLDGTNSNEATQVQAYLRSIVLERSIVVAQRRAVRWSLLDRRPLSGVQGGGRGVPIETRIRVRFNQSLQSSHFMVPGVIAMILMVLTVTMTAVSLVREKETGTLQQILATPMPGPVFLAGKMIPFVLVGLVDVALILVTGRIVFGMPLAGSLVFLYLVSFLFIFTTLGFGLLVSIFARTQQQAMIGSYSIVAPNLLLAGFVFPIDSMPGALQALTVLFPMRFFLGAIRGIMLKGVGIETLWPEVATLLLYGLVGFGLSVLFYARQRALLTR